MNELTAKDAARGFSEVLSRVAYGRERLVVTRRGRALAALVPIEDLAQLEKRDGAGEKGKGSR